MINMNQLLELAKLQLVLSGRTPIRSVCGFCAYFNSLGQFIGDLLIPAFSIAGILLVLYILWGGFKWLSSGGSKEGVSAARQMITHAVIGMVLLVLIFVLFKFIPEFFGTTFKIFG
jgi:hypothetical protein